MEDRDPLELQQPIEQQQLIYTVVPEMQTLNIDGLEPVFIPLSAVPTADGYTFTVGNGQQGQLTSQQRQAAVDHTSATPQPVSLIKISNVFPTSIVQDITEQTVRLPTGTLY